MIIFQNAATISKMNLTAHEERLFEQILEEDDEIMTGQLRGIVDDVNLHKFANIFISTN